MTPSEALADIRGFASAGRIVYGFHARQRMRERRVRQVDVQTALVGAVACRFQPEEGTWKATGPDADGDELTVIVALEDGVVVVTVF